MKYPKTILFAVGLSCIVANASAFGSIVINPTDDAFLRNSINRDMAIVVMRDYRPGGIQGAIKFSTDQISGPIAEAYLALSLFVDASYAPVLEVYGMTSSSSVIDVTDFNAGTFLGTMELPEHLLRGEDIALDVTGFMTSINSPYVGFSVRSQYSQLTALSSLEQNVGHPAQLHVTLVPEPTIFAFAAFGALAITLFRMLIKFGRWRHPAR